MHHRLLVLALMIQALAPVLLAAKLYWDSDMPKVPSSTFSPNVGQLPERPPLKTYDPFNTRVKDKDQSRVTQGVWPKPSPTEMLMAAAIMDQRGRLFEPDLPELQAPPTIEGAP